MKIVSFAVGLVLGLLVSVVVIYGDALVPSTIQPIYFPEPDVTLYLKKDNWGISGDGQIMALSTSEKSDIDRNSEEDYILEGLSQIFYKQDRNTLTLFVTRKFNQPKRFESGIIIKQVELENSEFQDLFDKARESIKLF
ncbi:hypothetical protein [Pedobacter sp. SYSU D00535]|uniref:hypothetical protein n=1 Tax=Pedobacter sp. SYSU D00535 TaxID=2810308 RepID=UPI001A97A51A|nr:hypothetical protein [Pedobacter sp. SYSU D00535]